VNCVENGTNATGSCCVELELFGPQQQTEVPNSVGDRLVIAGGFAYWTENSTIRAWVMRRPTNLSSGAEIVFTRPQANNNAETFGPIAVVGTTVFYVDIAAGNVMKVTVGGTPTIAAAGMTPYWMVADATNVYFTGSAFGAGGGVYRLAASGGEPVQIAQSTSATGYLAVNATDVYWVERSVTGSIRRIAK
jgi:hypothetical protein